MATEHERYIQILQTKLVGFLKNYIELVNESDTVLYRTFNFTDVISLTQNIDQQESIDEIQRKIQDVEVLQIRMPVVASMKAGKSTLINAFIGNEFLPTRADAMTALPTAVVLKLGQSNVDGICPPQFILEEETLKAIENLWYSVTQILKETFSNDKELDTLFLSNPHLVETANKLRNDQALNLNFKNKLEDCEQVRAVLTFINELVRISVYLSSRYPSLSLSLDAFLKNIPAIDVNYQPVSETPKNLKHRCQLLLIDTPGPNEAAGLAQFPRFVANELRKADVMLVVVEYGHLNTDSDARIADDIEKIRQLKNNQQCIYVLVNKADLHKEKDMTKDQVRQHVATRYKVGVDFVFLLSGSYALIAQKFLTDYQKNGDQIQVKTSSTAKDVLQLYYPVNWRKKLEVYQLNELKNDAVNLYEESGLTNVLDSVLATILDQVVKRCILSAINTCTGISKNLITDVGIRLSGLKLIEARLHQEIQELNQDLSDLAQMEKEQLVAMKQISTQLDNELKAIFQTSLNDCNLKVEQIFHRDNKKWIDAAEEIRRKEEEQTELQQTIGAVAISGFAGACVMHSVRTDGDFSLGAIFGTLFGLAVFQKVMKFLRGNENEIQFNNKEDANTFINGITEMVNQLTKSMYNTIEKQVNDTCSKSCEKFHSQISKRMKEILCRANERLNSTFNVNQITPKRIDSKLDEIHLDVVDIGRAQQYRSNSLFGLLLIKQKDNGSTWILSRSKLQEKCLESVKANLDRIQIDIVENTNNEMQKDFTSLYSDLQDYLLKYKRYAEICVSDKKLTEENQAQFILRLQELEESLIKKAEEVADFNECINSDKRV